MPEENKASKEIEMPKFTTQKFQAVVPQKKQTGNRVAALLELIDAMRFLTETDPTDPDRQVLVVELEEGDNMPTLRNRVRSASDNLGISVYMRKQRSTKENPRNEVIIYRIPDGDETDEEADEDDPEAVAV